MSRCCQQKSRLLVGEPPDLSGFSCLPDGFVGMFGAALVINAAKGRRFRTDAGMNAARGELGVSASPGYTEASRYLCPSPRWGPDLSRQWTSPPGVSASARRC